MSTLPDIESVSERLDNQSPGQLSGWLEDYLAEKWEHRFAADAQTGKLDLLGQAANLAFEQTGAARDEAHHHAGILAAF